MKMSLKKTIAKLLNWSGLQYTWDADTNNTADSWILVTKDCTTIQHRVLPANANASLTKYGSVWKSGSINLYRRGNTVFVNGDPTFNQTTSRTRFGTIPSGFIPASTAYVWINGGTDYLLFNTDGSVQANARGAGQCWFSGVYVVNS